MPPNIATLQRLEQASNALFAASQSAHIELSEADGRAILDLYSMVKAHQAEIRAGQYIAQSKSSAIPTKCKECNGEGWRGGAEEDCEECDGTGKTPCQYGENCDCKRESGCASESCRYFQLADQPTAVSPGGLLAEAIKVCEIRRDHALKKVIR